jgi:hypothetical protein
LFTVFLQLVRRAEKGVYHTKVPEAQAKVREEGQAFLKDLAQ